MSSVEGFPCLQLRVSHVSSCRHSLPMNVAAVSITGVTLSPLSGAHSIMVVVDVCGNSTAVSFNDLTVFTFPIRLIF